MASNFDFLKNIDKDLYSAIIDAEKLFRDEYFSQCCVQLRIYAEKTAKKILGNASSELTFDDTINCLKDKIKSEQEREFIDDLFYIKKEGNKCAHGEDVTSVETIEAIRRAFEIAINYCYSKKKDEKLLKLRFDETLLITQKPLKENKLVDKYVELAAEKQEELLNLKQGEFDSAAAKQNNGVRDERHVNNPKIYKNKKYPKKKKELTPAQLRVKEKIKEAKKNLKQTINKKPKKLTKKQRQQKSKIKQEAIKMILFTIFVTISLCFLIKMIFLN